MTHSAGYHAEYAGKRFQTGKNDKEYNSVFCGGPLQDYRVADIYLKFKDGSIQRLIEFPETLAQTWISRLPPELQKQSIVDYSGKNGISLTAFQIDGENSLTFHEGKLVSCFITERRPSRSPFFGVQVGASPDGEFLSFPFSHEDLVRVFGKPEKLRKLED